MLKKPFACITMLLMFSITQASADNTCEICERISSFDSLVNKLSKNYWPGFDEQEYRVPLFYFTQEHTYMSFPNKKLKSHFKAQPIACTNGLKLYKLPKRVDSIPFHMSNQTNIDNKRSPYYRNPVMFCSDVVTASSLIPDITHTEEWSAIVMHEYFHGFQLKHKAMMTLLADSIKMNADTLIGLYRAKEWFKNALKEENEMLLSGIAATSTDSAKWYVRKYLELRDDRRKRFKEEMGYAIERYEDFWEKLEGPARYVEYHLSYIYQNSTPRAKGCDTFFNSYRTYKQQGFEQMPWMHDKTTMMPAYFYVTGFNMCRLLDKLGIKYKNDLFDHYTSLTNILRKAVY